MRLRSCCLLARTSRDFVPAADSLSWAPKKVSKETARVPSPSASLRVPCDARLLQRGAPELQQPNNQQPSPQAGWRRLFIHPPFESAEERRTLRPRAQRASLTDSAQLFERSVAKRVLRGASRSEHHRAARCEAKGRAVRGRLFAFVLVAQKVGRPPGRNPGMGLPEKPNPQRSV